MRDKQTHVHNWQFVEINDGVKTYYPKRAAETFAYYMANRTIMKQEPDTATFICECGVIKEVEVRDES